MSKKCQKNVKSVAGLAQLVEQAHIDRNLLLDAAAAGSTQTCGPLLHVIPLLSPLSCLHLPSKNNLKKGGQKCQKNILKCAKKAPLKRLKKGVEVSSATVILNSSI